MDLGFHVLLHLLNQSLQQMNGGPQKFKISQNEPLIHFGKSFYHLIIFRIYREFKN
jgi:hypothetical protein